MTKKEALKKIAALVERFNEQKEFYKRSDYNETLTCRDFIDPFFKSLGWDRRRLQTLKKNIGKNFASAHHLFCHNFRYKRKSLCPPHSP